MGAKGVATGLEAVLEDLSPPFAAIGAAIGLAPSLGQCDATEVRM